MHIHHTHLPENIIAQLSLETAFNTIILKSNNHLEQRIAEQESPMRRYYIHNLQLNHAQYQELLRFFNNRIGQKYAFLLKDPFENKAHLLHKLTEPILKPYIIYNDAEHRLIRDNIIIDSNSLSIKHDSEAISFTIDEGKIKVSAPEYIDKIIELEFQFYVPVRFAQDKLVATASKDNSIIIENIELIEVIL